MQRLVKYYEDWSCVSVVDDKLLVGLVIIGPGGAFPALPVVRVMSKVDNEYFKHYDSTYDCFYVDLEDEGQFYLERLMTAGVEVVYFGLETILNLTKAELFRRSKHVKDGHSESS